MNVSELARKLKISTKELLEKLPTMGFDIGQRAIKVDDRVAQKIIQNWPRLLAAFWEREKEIKEKEEVVKEPQEKIKIAIPSLIRVRDFANKLNLPISKVLAELMKNGVLASMNEMIDFETAMIIGSDLGFEIIPLLSKAVEEKEVLSVKDLRISDSEVITRPPVVVVLGHVDHGKTKLLDAIRKTNIIATEVGGITQHIGAYQVVVPLKAELPSRAERGIPRSSKQGQDNKGIPPPPRRGRDDFASGRKITFIDTPGHEAFTTMRSRGAKIADIAILVVAANDGVQPQTKESIKIIKLAKIPMIIAINKIDLPEANPDKVKQDLATLGLVAEDWGGETICVPISAKLGQGIDNLLEMILLVADFQKDKIIANPYQEAVGTIIESHLDKGEGPVITILVQNGTFKIGDLITINEVFYGKIRVMKDFTGKNITEAQPSTPAKVLGLKVVPAIGDVIKAKKQLVKRASKIKKYQLIKEAVGYQILQTPKNKETEDLSSQALNLIIKADVLGSLEAITSSLDKLSHPEIAIKVVGKGLGNISRNDILKAEGSETLILGFNIKMPPDVEGLVKETGVEVKIYSVIYDLIEDIKNRLEKMLKPEMIRTELGRLKILAIFRKDKESMIVGGKVTKGKVILGSKIDILREEKKIGKGDLVQLQINKINVKEVELGKECGIKYQGKPIIEVGDTLEVYLEEIKEKKLR